MSDLRQKLAELAMSEAAQYGEAKSKSVIGKAMGKYPELRSSAKDLMDIIDDVITEVNSMSDEDLQPYLPTKKPKAEKVVERELPPLHNPDPPSSIHFRHNPADYPLLPFLLIR